MNEPEKTPIVDQNEGLALVEGMQQLIEGKPVLTVCSALTVILFAASTGSNLNRESREALTVMIHDLLGNVMNANDVSEERLQVLMAQRGGRVVMASEAGHVVLEAPEDQEAAG